jgi:putative transposase
VATEASYKGYRYPVEIISHCVWLYYRFALSLRDISEMMLERGVVVSHETVRQWCAKFGQGYANQLRRRRPRPGDKWHVDEVFIRISGQHHYLWRAVDQDGNVLDVLVQSRRNALAAKKFLRRLLKGLHRRSRYLNNRAENSYQPTRQRERAMKTVRFAPAGAAVPLGVQRHHTALRLRRHLLTASEWRREMTDRFAVWNEITGLSAAA